MAEYIQREAALAALCSGCDKMFPSDERDHCSYRFTGCMEYYYIFELAAADVRPVVRGRWKRVDPRSTVVTFRCSECNYYAHMNATNFCPNCGADMSGGTILK